MVDGVAGGYRSWEAALAAAPATPVADECAGALMMYSSGTTGFPKGAVSTHGNLSPNVGLVRVVDLQAGLIPHALAIGVGCANGQGVYPAAVGTDYACPYTPGAYYGARFQLTLTDTQIAALAVPSYDKVIYIGTNGKIAKVFEKVKPEGHNQEIIAALKVL